MRHPSLSFRLWYCTCEMTTKAAEETPAGTKVKATDTEDSAARTKEEPADTTGWVYKCSCGEEFETSIALGGHCSSYRSDKAHHKSLGFGPSRKAAERAVSPKAVDTDEPAELYISDKDRAAAAGKPQDETKKPTGEKRDRTTTNIDEAAIIAIAPKEFKTSSILLWQAQKVAENLWNWPKIDYRLGGSLHKMQDNACRLCYICQV